MISFFLTKAGLVRIKDLTPKELIGIMDELIACLVGTFKLISTAKFELDKLANIFLIGLCVNFCLLVWSVNQSLGYLVS